MNSKRFAVVLAGVVVLALVGPSYGALVAYTDRAAWESAVAAMGKLVQTETLENTATFYGADNPAVGSTIPSNQNRNLGGPTFQADPWSIAAYSTNMGPGWIQTPLLSITGDSTSSSGPAGIYDATKASNVISMSGNNSFTLHTYIKPGTIAAPINVMAIGMDGIGSGSVSIAGAAGVALPATWGFVGWIDTTGSLSISQITATLTGSYISTQIDNISYAYQSTNVAPVLTSATLNGVAGDTSINEGQSVTLGGSGTDGDLANTLTLKANLTTVATGTNGTVGGSTATSVFTDEGTVAYTFKVNDGTADSNTITRTLTINNVAPSIGSYGLTVLGDKMVNSLFEVFAAGITDPGTGDTFTYYWSLDNGAFVAGDLTSNISFATMGAHTVAFKVMDNDGGATIQEFGVNVIPEPATMSLLVLGAAGLFMRRRSRS